MVRKGQVVTILTPKIGQKPRHGRVISVKEGFVEVEWEDGHVSLLTKESVVPVEHSADAGAHRPAKDSS